MTDITDRLDLHEQALRMILGRMFVNAPDVPSEHECLDMLFRLDGTDVKRETEFMEDFALSAQPKETTHD